ncbi:hypothetical protein Pint_30002 [Pistacia integerrima]|uniref:Uncharacterized protein n=1 Tax=Pistacia integerrima TaxID=434235 RepID=A0ACC0X0D6_9ROSI|nr:hypothetical protein Pint_30002 [Pistacia integerrima]
MASLSLSSHFRRNAHHHRSQTCPETIAKSLTFLARSLSTGSRSIRRYLAHGDGHSSLDLESGRQREEGNPLTQEEWMSFLKKPVNGIHDAISKIKFQALSMPSELAGFESSPNFIRETKIAMANLSEIEGDEDNFEANAPSHFPESKSSTPLLPESEINHEAHHIRNDSSQKDSTEEKNNNDIHPIHGSPTDSEYLSCTDVDQGTSIRKTVILEWVLVVANVVTEVLTATLDQLSSAHKSNLALFATVTSFVTLGFCIIEIWFKCSPGKHVWKMKGKFYWFYNAGDGKPFGSIPGIIGLVSGTLQFILTAVAYGVYYSRHVDSPIKLHICSVVFAIGPLCSKIIGEKH